MDPVVRMAAAHYQFEAIHPFTDGNGRTGRVPNILKFIAAGLLVGAGTALGSGCTSGHGICGISRLSVRSIVAVVTFIAAGVLTVFVTRHVWGA